MLKFPRFVKAKVLGGVEKKTPLGFLFSLTSQAQTDRGNGKCIACCNFSTSFTRGNQGTDQNKTGVRIYNLAWVTINYVTLVILLRRCWFG